MAIIPIRKLDAVLAQVSMVDNTFLTIRILFSLSRLTCLWPTPTEF